MEEYVFIFYFNVDLTNVCQYICTLATFASVSRIADFPTTPQRVWAVLGPPRAPGVAVAGRASPGSPVL